MWFYVIVFGALAVFVVVAALSKMAQSRRRVEEDAEVHHATQAPHAAHATTDHARQIRKEKRAESRRERRKRK